MMIEGASKDPNRKPIFIHSLFRAGSTYVFNVFRRSDHGYWCYQEPLHELAFWAQSNKKKLLEADGGTATTLRHPILKRPYFFELYEVADKCLPLLKKSQIYDAYFPDGCEDFGLNFFESLIDAARGAAVIQECRTSMRIHALKSSLGGFHVYLWRNPWDQWWSYKVDDFFDPKNQLFINGKTYPEIVGRLRQEIGFSGFDSEDLQQQFAWFSTNRLTPDDNYLVFYTLWLLGLQHGAENADVLVNIDRLSDDHDYRQQIADELESKGFGGLNFSDCEVPQTCYGQKDRAFFERIEDKAHGLFLLSGTSQEALSKLLELRHSAAPRVWRNAGKQAVASNLIRDAERARALVRRFEQREVDFRSEVTQQIRNHATHAAIAESKACDESDRAARAEERLRKAEERALQAAARVFDLEQQVEMQSRRAVAAEEVERRLVSVDLQRQREAALAAELQKKYDELQGALEVAHGRAQYWRVESERWHERILDLHRSNSWRITAPIRAVKRVVMGDFSPLCRVVGSITKRLRRVLRPRAVLAARAMLRRPSLRHKISAALRKYPTLRQHFVLFVKNAGLVTDEGVFVPHALAPIESVERLDLRAAAESGLSNMSADAREIYVALKVAIEGKEGKI